MYYRANIFSDTALLILSGFILLRGLAVLLTNAIIDREYLYFSAFFCVLIISAYGATKIRSIHFSRIDTKIIIVSCIYLLIWALIEITQESISTLRTFVLLGLSPFMVYAFLGISRKKVVSFLFFITIIHAVILHSENFLINFTPDNAGLSLATQIQSSIRPEITGWSKANNIYRTVGIFGLVPHFSGITMAMLTTFWGSRFLCSSKLDVKSLFIFLIAGSALLTTISGTAISATLICLSILFIIRLIRAVLSGNRSRITGYFVSALIFFYLLSLAVEYIVHPITAPEMGPETAQENADSTGQDYTLNLSIYTALEYVALFFKYVGAFFEAFFYRLNLSAGNYSDLLDLRLGREEIKFHNVIFGHLSTENRGLATVEIPLIRYIFIYGAFGAGLIFTLLMLPILRFFGNRCVCSDATPFTFSTFCGFLTLGHYDYLFSTSIVLLFWLFYAKSEFGRDNHELQL